MKFLFDWELNLAILKLVDSVQREKLIQVLDLIQSENKDEIEVTVECFPMQLVVKVDSDELLVCWNSEKSVYKVMRREDAVFVLDEKKKLVNVMSIQELEQKSRRGKK